MNKGTTVFYHHHIQDNIAKLEQRKDKFIHFRIEFLKEFCEPIHQKIQNLLLQIQKCKIMRDTQEEVIETEPQIASLKKEIQSYNHTQEYFKHKVDQYQKKSIEFDQYNRDLAKQIEYIKGGLRNIKELAVFQLPELSRKRLKTIQDEKASIVSQTRSFVLPTISNGSSHEIINQINQSESKVSNKSKKIVKISEKIQRIKVNNSHLQQKSREKSQKDHDISNEKEEPKISNKKQMQSLRERITKFNKTESLFQQCFEIKKNSVQKSVSQLQSKLIVNREQFLNTCKAIGQKEKSISFEQFNKLTCEQILTLFISFVWLNKKLKNEFAVKRKAIMDYIGKLPKQTHS